MRYHSSRDDQKTYSFQEILFRGLAEDGGLYLPTSIPFFQPSQIRAMEEISYQELMLEIVQCFVEEIGKEDLKKIIDLAYQNFDRAEIVPLKQLDQNLFFLELFHSPTLAFKDYAMQFLGQLFNFFVQKENKKLIVLGATSGDTGSAAIHAFKKIPSAEVFILHPHEKISPLQRRQMTTVREENIHNLAIEGHFDDCQHLVKTIFNDQNFLAQLERSGRNLIAVNSINWARVMAQMGYYFSGYLQSRAGDEEPVVFSVPTGNFGNIFAGLMASKMGLPVHRFVSASNQNDILHRFFQNNDYRVSPLQQTFSPSMDIVVASNLERYLFLLYQDPQEIKRLMDDFKNTGKLEIDPQRHREVQKKFSSASVSDEETLSTIKEIKRTHDLMIDPHSAVAFKALEKAERIDPDLKRYKRIVLGTAHPGKFNQTIEKTGIPFSLPDRLRKLESLSENFRVFPSDSEVVKDEITRFIQ